MLTSHQEATSDSFEAEFSIGAEQDRDMDDYDLRRFLLFSRTGIDPRVYKEFSDYYPTSLTDNAYVPDSSFLHGKIVLDAGCGPGRFTEVVAREGAEYVVGVELGGHVERARRRCRDLDNVDFVQGSVLEPPFRAGVFDYVFSIGVLHHTGDAEKGFTELAGLVSDSGALSVWVYPPEYWGGRIRGPIARKVHRWMSHLSPVRALRVARRVLYPLGMLQMKIAGKRGLKWVLAPLFLISVPRHPRREIMLATILDYYTPRYISTHSTGQLLEWARKSGFTDTTPLPVAASCLVSRNSKQGRNTP